MYEYRAKIRRIVDGDTVDVDVDLGFGIWMMDERVRIKGIDTPESRTRDKTEKQFGLASKARLKQLLPLGSIQVLRTTVNKDGEDMKGKFGRIIGDFQVYYAPTDNTRPAGNILIEEGYAVAYTGGSKQEIEQQHLANRKRLLQEGKILLK